MSAPHIKPDLSEYVRCWAEGKFFEAHEALEPRWTRERDPGLQGLIQLAAALHHLRNANLRGAARMLDRALPKLRDQRAAPCPIDLRVMADYATAVRAQLESAGAAELIAARPRSILK